ncbi:hypothetical protein TNCV_11711 [Trichonephila clavipes]|nr:hypothetical protein TNCV_11711 [Trichonephila clavipes]
MGLRSCRPNIVQYSLATAIWCTFSANRHSASAHIQRISLPESEVSVLYDYRYDITKTMMFENCENNCRLLENFRSYSKLMALNRFGLGSVTEESNVNYMRQYKSSASADATTRQD